MLVYRTTRACIQLPVMLSGEERHTVFFVPALPLHASGLCYGSTQRKICWGGGRYETATCGLVKRGRDRSEGFCLVEAEKLGVAKGAARRDKFFAL